MSELDYIKTKHLHFGVYMGQARCLRKIAIELFGIDKVAQLPDEDIEKLLLNEGYIPMLLNHDGNNEETIYLIKEDVLESCKKLER